MTFRYLLFTLIFYGFYSMYDMPYTYDWQNCYEIKHEQNLYGDLIEGGEEGDDD
jgi:hypothetical protein